MLIKLFIALLAIWSLALATLAFLAGRLELLLLLLVLPIIVRLLRKTRFAWEFATSAKREIYIGESYDEKSKRYRKLYLPLESLRTTLIYGSPLSALANLLTQVSRYYNTIIFDSSGSLRSILQRILPIRIFTPNEFRVDPFESDAHKVVAIFDLSFKEASYETRTKMKSLILSYYDLLGKDESPSLKGFATVFLDAKESAERSDKFAIMRAHDLLQEVFRLECFEETADVEKTPPNLLYFDLSTLLSRGAKLLYTFATLSRIHQHWGPVFAVLNDEILPLGTREWGENLKTISEVFRGGVYLCLTTAGCPIDPSCLSQMDTIFVGNCIADYRLSSALRDMFPKNPPSALRPSEYLFRSQMFKALVISPMPKEMVIETLGKRGGRISLLEREVGEDAEKAYEILRRLDEIKYSPRSALATYFGRESEIVIDKLSSLGYIVFKTEQVKDRFLPVVKLTNKGVRAIEEFQRRIEAD